MSREKKFRAWNSRLKIFEEDFFIGACGGLYTYDYELEVLEKCELMQFTGLLDKNGMEIYEGDLCTVTDPYNNKTSFGAAQVVFSTDYVGGWVLTVDGRINLNIGTRTNYIKIIGNIYENSELISE